MENIHALIMAGGTGTRFWPLSRRAIPKQFLNFVGSRSMIQQLSEQIRTLIPMQRTWVVSTKEQEQRLKEQLSWLLPANMILEPFGKNTAPCIGLSALYIHRSDPDAIMITMPSDHLILNTENFIKVLHRGVELVTAFPDSLATIGIEPTYPATGYGYIQCGEQIDGEYPNVQIVRAFAEKPSYEFAQKFYESNEFVWNSGIFIWRVDTILNHLAELMPELFDGLTEIKKAMDTDKLDRVTERVYKQIRSQSIDYGVMEHANKVFVIQGDFGWSDLESWEEVYKISEKDKFGNVYSGNIISKKVSNSYIQTSDRIVALIGIDNLIVIDTPDALLICDRNQSQDVKWVVEKLKHENLEKYL